MELLDELKNEVLYWEREFKNNQNQLTEFKIGKAYCKFMEIYSVVFS